MPTEINAYADSDYAGCIKTRKSTSGGAIMIGNHCIKSWSSTQSVIALSSGEAELYSLVKATSQAIGIKHMLGEKTFTPTPAPQKTLLKEKVPARFATLRLINCGYKKRSRTKSLTLRRSARLKILQIY